MPSFEITYVSDKIRPWDSTKGGPMKSYRVEVRDEQGTLIPNVEWARKADSPPPAVGQKLEGTLDTSGQYGPKFKAAQTGGGSGGGGRPRDPAERRSIQMQHAQKCAVEALRLAAQFGDGDAKYVPPSAADVVAQIKVIASGLYQQIEEVAA